MAEKRSVEEKVLTHNVKSNGLQKYFCILTFPINCPYPKNNKDVAEIAVKTRIFNEIFFPVSGAWSKAFCPEDVFSSVKTPSSGILVGADISGSWFAWIRCLIWGVSFSVCSSGVGLFALEVAKWDSAGGVAWVDSLGFSSRTGAISKRYLHQSTKRNG